MMTFTSAALLKGSEGSRPAKKFLDFLVTPEAQSIIGNIPGIAPVMTRMRPTYVFEHEYGSRTKFHPTPDDFRLVASTVAQFRKLRLP
jgi:ABC-type thiamine transport system substrate-binding protein